MTLTPKPGVLDIQPYVGGRARVDGVQRATKLSSNESALGPSPRAVEAFINTSHGLALYPDGGVSVLRETIAREFGLDAERIVCGNGSGELLALLAHAYLRPGDEVMFTEHGFLVYRIETLANSATPVVVPETERHADVEAMLSRATAKTRIVFLANPNNPTGTYLSHTQVRRLHSGLGPGTILVLDAAYGEFVRRNDYEAGIEMVANFSNVVMTRTFSKVHGLAGLRVGWAYCPRAIADVLNRVRGPFNVSLPAQAAAAAALSDHSHVEEAVAHNEKWRAWLTDNIRKTGLKVDDSVANFVLIRFPSAERAGKADAFLGERGLILRSTANYGLPDCLRLTVGREEANRAVVVALSAFQAQP